MSGDNPLVAEEAGRDPLAGTFGLYDGYHLVDDLANHHYLAASLDGVATALDTAATVSDPIGTALAAGVGWLLDHVDPLKTWLNDLAGNAELVKSYGETWENVAGKLEQTASTLRSNVSSDLAGMTGDAVEAYRRYAEDLIGTVEDNAKTASAMSTGFVVMGTVVDAVHGLVRDTLAVIIADGITWVAEEVFSLGLATGWVVEQITTRVSAAVAEIGDKVHGIVESVEALKTLLQKLGKAVDAIRDTADKIHPDLLGHRAEHRVETSAPRHRADPDHPSSGTDTGRSPAGDDSGAGSNGTGGDGAGDPSGTDTPGATDGDHPAGDGPDQPAGPGADQPNGHGRHEQVPSTPQHAKTPTEILQEKIKEALSAEELTKAGVGEGAAAGATTASGR